LKEPFLFLLVLPSPFVLLCFGFFSQLFNEIFLGTLSLLYSSHFVALKWIRIGILARDIKAILAKILFADVAMKKRFARIIKTLSTLITITLACDIKGISLFDWL